MDEQQTEGLGIVRFEAFDDEFDGLIFLGRESVVSCLVASQAFHTMFDNEKPVISKTIVCQISAQHPNTKEFNVHQSQPEEPQSAASSQ